jgi:hypothetical protein
MMGPKWGPVRLLISPNEMMEQRCCVRPRLCTDAEREVEGDKEAKERLLRTAAAVISREQGTSSPVISFFFPLNS